MGADKILADFEKAEAQLEAVREKAEPSSRRSNKTEKKSYLHYERTLKRRYHLKIVKNNLTDWARELVDKKSDEDLKV